MSCRIRLLQTATAAAALLAVLGACGLPAPGRRPRGVVRPPPRRAEVTIRSLTGTWVAQRHPSGGEALTMVLVQNGDSLTGTLVVDGTALASNPAAPARLDSGGRFTLEFGRTHERLNLTGRPDATADRIVASISGWSEQPIVFAFDRR
jgi:hypothetical protein